MRQVPEAKPMTAQKALPSDEERAAKFRKTYEFPVWCDRPLAALLAQVRAEASQELDALRAKAAECEREHPPEPEYTAWMEAGKPDVRAPREENARTERLRTCGQHPLLGDVTQQGSRACGRVLSVGDLYRCADCQTAFCRECIRRHFADETPEAREMMRRAEERARLDAEPATEKEGDRE